MLDDVGSAGVGFSARYNQGLVQGSNETFFEAQYEAFTPNLDRLAAAGLQLNRMYAYAECTPSRQALLSGRLPVHNGVIMRDADRWDGGVNIDNGYDGLSPNVTCFAKKLKDEGYRTHVVGKQDGFGMATLEHLAVSEKRGFDTSMGYFNHANNPWNYTLGEASIGTPAPCLETFNEPYVIDMMVNVPGNVQSLRATPYFNCSSENLDEACEYQDLVFTKRVLDLIDTSSSDEPWMIWYSSHLAHTPMALPDRYFQRVLELCGPDATDERFRGQCVLEERQRYLASIMMFDDNVGRIVERLKARGLYDNTLIVFTSDNGGGIGQGVGGNNWPNRGGKASVWEGGLRVPAFVSGGFIPTHRRGHEYDYPVALSDWYATFCSLAGGTLCTGPGADPTGEQVPGIVPVESVNLWPFLMGENTAPPHVLLHTAPTSLLKVEPGTGKIYKLVTGIVGSDMLTSPNYPNCSVAKTAAALCPPSATLGPCLDDPTSQCCAVRDAGPVCDPPTLRPASGSPFAVPSLAGDCKNGCLYELTEDYSESRDLSSEPAFANLYLQMQSLLFTLNETYYEPFRGCDVPQVLCPAALNQWNHTFGPFLNIPGCDGCVFTTQEYRNSTAPVVPRTTNQCQCYTSESDCNANNATCSWYAARGRCDLVDDMTWRDYLSLRRFSPQFYDNYAELFD
jgi:arylsulfatase I/J